MEQLFVIRIMKRCPGVVPICADNACLSLSLGLWSRDHVYYITHAQFTEQYPVVILYARFTSLNFSPDIRLLLRPTTADFALLQTILTKHITHAIFSHTLLWILAKTSKQTAHPTL